MILLAQIIMGIAYALFLTAALPNIFTAYKNRHTLRGFNKWGVTLTALGLTLTQTSLYIDGAYIPVVIGLLNHYYWIMLAYWIWKNGVTNL